LLRFPVPVTRRVFLPPSDAAAVARLLDREDALISLGRSVIEFAPTSPQISSASSPKYIAYSNSSGIGDQRSPAGRDR